MIAAVDLLRGLAKLIGWRRIDVPGATGYLDTDYAAKGRYAVPHFDDADLVGVHVEAPDEASHEGDAAAKINALEQIDRHIVGPLCTRAPGVRRLSHPGMSRPSHAAADEYPYPWRRAVCPGGQRCSPRRRHGLRRRPPRVVPGVRRRLAADGLLPGKGFVLALIAWRRRTNSNRRFATITSPPNTPA